MNRVFAHVFTIIGAVAATGIFAAVALQRSHIVGGSLDNQTNAAFRDGVFLARLDAEHGRKLHLTSGRWSTDADRRLFVAAYLKTYHEMRGDRPTSELLASSAPAAKKGLRDGLADGRQRRREFRSFQPTANKNYLRADHGYSDDIADLEQYRQAYREAYCNGYQEAYYGEAVQVEMADLQKRKERQ